VGRGGGLIRPSAGPEKGFPTVKNRLPPAPHSALELPLVHVEQKEISSLPSISEPAANRPLRPLAHYATNGGNELLTGHRRGIESIDSLAF